MIPYTNIAKAVALRANQLSDAIDAAALNDQFEDDLKENLGGMDVPYAALKLAILATEKRIVGLIGKTQNPIWRAQVYGVTDNIPSGGLIPYLNSTGAEFFGSFSNCLDAVNFLPLTEQPKQVVARRNRNAGEFYKLESFHFCIEANRVYHTRENVVMEGVCWNEAKQLLLFDLPVLSAVSKSFAAEDVNVFFNRFTITNHGFITGIKVKLTKGNSANSLPSPLVANDYYYIIRLDDDTIQLASTIFNAFNAIPVDITTIGTNHNNLVIESLSGGLSPLPAEFENLWICDVLAHLPQENWFVQEAGYYQNLANRAEQLMMQGIVPSVILPNSTANSEPIKN